MTRKLSQKRNNRTAAKPRKPSARKSTRQQTTRPRSSGAEGHQLVFGIDPANETCGVALVKMYGQHPVLLASKTISAWDTHALKGLWKLVPETSKVRIYYEVPPPGRGMSTDAISRAAGMVIQMIRTNIVVPILRKDVYGVVPSSWRKTVFGSGKVDSPKEKAVDLFTGIFAQIPATHDAAEAALIALHGCKQQEGSTK